jgi:hypothetical protein
VAARIEAICSFYLLQMAGIGGDKGGLQLLFREPGTNSSFPRLDKGCKPPLFLRKARQ